MKSQLNELGTYDKMLIEDLIGDLGENSIEVLHSHHGKYLIPSFQEMYDEIEDLCDDEQISIRPTLCRDDYGTVSQYGQRCLWVSLDYESTNLWDRYQPRKLEKTLNELPYRPSAILDTGGSMVGCWLLTENLTSVSGVDLAEWTMHWLTAGIKAKALDIYDERAENSIPDMFTRYMKVPGALNPDCPHGTITELNHLHSHFCYSVIDLAHMAWELTHENWPQSVNNLIHPRLRHMYV